MSNECQYCDFYSREIEKLKQENEKLKSALGFYGNVNNWKRFFIDGLYPSYPRNVFNKIDCEEFCSSYEYGDYEDICGKLARLTLKEIEESK